MASNQEPIDKNSEINKIFSAEFETENLVFLNPRLNQDDHQSLIDLAESVSKIRNLKGHVWIATSGSTAESIKSTKLVALSKSALMASAQAVNEFFKISEMDIWAQVLPHFHVGGLGIEIRAYLSHSKVVHALKNGKWNPTHFYQTLINHKVTLSALVPTQVYDLVALKLSAPSSLRVMIVGGGAMDESLYRQARALGWPVLPSYGMTETCSQIATASLESLIATKMLELPDLFLLPHSDVKTSETGLLKIKATSLLTCYAQRSATDLHHWDPKNEGWFTTEDHGEFNPIQRSIMIVGRDSEYIKIGGEGCNLASLRSHLSRAILEVAGQEVKEKWPLQLCLIDMPSERLGAEIHLVSTLKQDIAESVADKYSEFVLPYEKIRKIHFVDEIPRTELGKIQWNLIRRKL